MNFQQIRDFVNPQIAQATGLQPVDDLQMPVPVAHIVQDLVIDGQLSDTSINPVQNKVVKAAIDDITVQFEGGIEEAVDNWLDDHPEATTTVQDGAITYAKLDNNLKAKADEVTELKSKVDDIENNMGFWYQKLVVPANTSHSASNDKLNVVIPSGSVYCIVCKMDGAYQPQIYAKFQDDTSERVYINTSSTYYSFSTVLTANADIKAFGISLAGTTSPKRTIELMVLTRDSVSGLFNYTNKTSAYIRYPQGKLCFKTGRSRVLVQSISVWNNQVWEFDEGHAYYNGVTYALDNGHANSCNWGTELHGDYPYLYCPTYSDGYNVKVYSFDGTGFTLESTITLSAYTSGYMTAYVDENAGYIYSFGYSDIYSGRHMFAVSDMTGTTVMTKLIPSKIPIVQGMCMHDGILYVTSGYGNAQYPNYLNKISTDGTLLGRFRMYGIGEIEGVDFLDNKMVLASYYEFYINPVLVPEVEFYGYVDQLKATT